MEGHQPHYKESVFVIKYRGFFSSWLCCSGLPFFNFGDKSELEKTTEEAYEIITNMRWAFLWDVRNGSLAH